MKNHQTPYALGSGLVLITALVVGCGGHDMHDGGAEVRSGMDQSRAALAVVDRGIAAFRAGDRSTGMSDMEKGLSMMAGSMSEMRAGLGMMSMDMMRGCGGSGEEMMRPVESSIGGMRAGHAMMLDADKANDDEALRRMEQGRTSTADALNAMHANMSCMGHGSTGMM